MPTTPIPMTFKDVVKNPYTYLLITVVSLLWYFVYANGNLANKQDNNCQQQIIELRIDNKKLQNDKDALYNAILLKNGLIGKLTTITDSLSKPNNDNAKHN